MGTLAPDTGGTMSLLFPDLPHRIGDRARAAMDDPQLQKFVSTATQLKDVTRERVLRSAFGDRATEVRQLAGAIKQHTLTHLDTYLEQFVTAAEGAGSVVHFAADAAEARQICLDIARRHDAKRCVKAKSMVTEEIQLLSTFEDAGIETVETDLGELVLQLDDDAPSHIVTPMIHKDRVAAGRAFERRLGTTFSSDPKVITAQAREYLREQFEQADIGVSGANFLVAETGSIVLCTNEGNARYSTTAPPVHIAVVGIEKVVPSHQELAVMLGVLARSSTGQPLTVYTTITTGPRRPEERDGPTEVHIVLLDNGRSRILADPVFREALRCIRCGACLNTCPVYRTIGGHAYGSVYPGPIGAVITPLMRGVAAYPDLPKASSLCGACHRACPVDIDLPKLLVSLRQRQVEERVVGWRARLGYRLWGWALRGRLRYRVASWLQGKVLRRRANLRGFLLDGPGPIGAWTQGRPLPAPADVPFRKRWKKLRGAAGGIGPFVASQEPSADADAEADDAS